ncbi:MAG: hypothetical protein ACLVJO_10240 [[Clostridium] scindens]
MIESPVKIEVKDGCIISMSGGEEAKRYEMWLVFGHPQMLRISHAGIGFHPGAKLIGDILLISVWLHHVGIWKHRRRNAASRRSLRAVAFRCGFVKYRSI